MILESTGRNTIKVEESLEAKKPTLIEKKRDVSETIVRIDSESEKEMAPILKQIRTLEIELERLSDKAREESQPSRDALSNVRKTLNEIEKSRMMLSWEGLYNDAVESGRMTPTGFNYVLAKASKSPYLGDFEMSEKRIIGRKQLAEMGINVIRMTDRRYEKYVSYFAFYGLKCIAWSCRRSGDHRGDESTPVSATFLNSERIPHTSGLAISENTKYSPISIEVTSGRWDRNASWKDLVQILLNLTPARLSSAKGMDFYNEINKKFWVEYENIY